ncbi:MAG: uracil-DNA glycosylase [Eubacteriales bacterium]
MDYSILGVWRSLLEDYFSTDAWGKLCGYVENSRKTATVYPPKGLVFRGLSLTQPDSVRVVILGQDPYHGANQANGLAFSVTKDLPFPPSLRNIFREMMDDLDVEAPAHGDLTHWAEQGVLLLNPVLTVEAGRANSHKDFGWQSFTDRILEEIQGFPQPVAFVLWGASAQKKAKLASNSIHPRLILQSPHPSPLSSYRGFFGSKPFSQINHFLTEHGENPIEWV